MTLKSPEQIREALLFTYYSLLERDPLFQGEFWKLRRELGLPENEFLSDDPDDTDNFYFDKFTLEQAIRIGRFLRHWHFPKGRGRLDVMQALVWAMPFQDGKTHSFTLRINEEAVWAVGLKATGATKKRSFPSIRYDPTSDSRQRVNAQIEGEAERLSRAALADLNKLEEKARTLLALRRVPPHRGARGNRKVASRLYLAVMQLVQEPTSVIDWEAIATGEAEENRSPRATPESIERNVREAARDLGISLRPTQLVRRQPRRASR